MDWDQAWEACNRTVKTVAVDDWAFEVPVDWPRGSGVLLASTKETQPGPLAFGVTRATGGDPTGVYARFNLAMHIEDKPSAVRRNRERLARYLGVPVKVCTCGNQTHELSIQTVTAENVGAGALSADDAFPRTDAIMTNEPGVPLLLFIADCVPVCVYDPVQQAVAVIHAGWRGVVGQLVPKTLAAMADTYGTRAADCYAYVGPSIQVQSFEVSEELAAQFRAQYGEAVVVYRVREGATAATPHVNLQRCLWQDWVAAGGDAKHMVVSPTDTMTTPSCFSYRREKGQTGRMALFAMLRGSENNNAIHERIDIL